MNGKKVLILGSGGREHTLAWKLAQEKQVEFVHVFPGNVGMETTPKVSVSADGEISKESIVAITDQFKPDLIVVGPENILAMGVADWPELSAYPVLGPSAWCAQLETSKCWAAQKMHEWGVPAPEFIIVKAAQDAENFLRQSIERSGGVAIKADGLKAGKGVVVSRNLEEARVLLREFLEKSDSVYYSPQVLLQELLPGPEVSLLALCDGKTYRPLGAASDYKRKFDGDAGPNTGGMGCVSRQEHELAENQEALNQLYETFFGSIVDGFARSGKPFVGFLFAGLMKDLNGQWKALEYNVRLGDPETQTLLPLVAEESFFEILLSAAKSEFDGRQGKRKLRQLQAKAMHVVLASGGYGEPDKTLSLNHKIGLPHKHQAGVSLFWAAVKKRGDALVNSGGRVVGVTAVAPTLPECRQLAYQTVSQIEFRDQHYRKDIGQ